MSTARNPRILSSKKARFNLNGSFGKSTLKRKNFDSRYQKLLSVPYFDHHHYIQGQHNDGFVFLGGFMLHWNCLRFPIARIMQIRLVRNISYNVTVKPVQTATLKKTESWFSRLTIA